MPNSAISNSVTTPATSPLVYGKAVYNSTATDVTNSAVLVDITGLSRTLSSGVNYRMSADLRIDANLAAGWRIGFGGTVVLSNVGIGITSMDEDNYIIASVDEYSGSNPATSGSGVEFVRFVMDGHINVTTGGTFTIQIAQKTATPATTTTALAYGTMTIMEM